MVFVSPWVYGAYYNADSWNSFIVGLVIASMAAITFGSGRRFRLFRWLTGLLGIWCFASPWVYSYTDNTGRFANGLSVGVVLFVLALID